MLFHHRRQCSCTATTTSRSGDTRVPFRLVSADRGFALLLTACWLFLILPGEAPAAASRQRSPTWCSRMSFSSAAWLIDVYGRGRLAEFEDLRRRRRREKVHDARDDASPAGLVTRAEPRAVVAVKVLIKQDQIAPMRIFLEFACAGINRPPTVRDTQEDAREPAIAWRITLA